MPVSSDIAETLSQLALFADLPPARVETIAHAFGEQVYAEEQRVLRQNLSGSGLFVILEGEAAIRLSPNDLRVEVSKRERFRSSCPIEDHGIDAVTAFGGIAAVAWVPDERIGPGIGVIL